MIKISQPIIGDEEKRAVLGVLDSGTIVQGPRVAELERRFADYCGVRFAVALASGTAALHTALHALNIKKGDEVITTPFTFVATANSILMQNAKLVFADISEDDFNLDPIAVEQKITPQTKAVLPVDLYGQVYKVEEIKRLSSQYNFFIIEDACQAIGATYCGERAGMFGDAGVFSLYATKNIMCGEGGILTTDDENVVAKAILFRNHGQNEKIRYEYVDMGYNYKMTDISAAIALEQLKKLDQLNRHRVENAASLTEGLKNIRGIITPRVREQCTHVYHQYTIRLTEDFRGTRDGLAEHLKSNNIGCGIYYPKPLHLHPHFMRLGFKPGDFPIAEKISKQVLSLPVHPGLSSDNIKTIIKTTQDYVI